MMYLKELLAKYPIGEVKSVVCLERLSQNDWVVGKVYSVVLNTNGEQSVNSGRAIYANPQLARFGVHELVKHTPVINPHMKDDKLPTLVTGFNPNIIEVDDCKQAHTYEELESLIRVGIDIQDILATNAPDLDRALVDLWFELKGIKK